MPEPYKPAKYPEGIHHEDGPAKKLIQALNETLKEEFRHNPDTFIWGQDLANKEKGGVFNVTKGMQQEFGKRAGCSMRPLPKILSLEQPMG